MDPALHLPLGPSMKVEKLTMKVGVIGLGYVGLPLAVGLPRRGTRWSDSMPTSDE